MLREDSREETEDKVTGAGCEIGPPDVAAPLIELPPFTLRVGVAICLEIVVVPVMTVIKSNGALVTRTVHSSIVNSVFSRMNILTYIGNSEIVVSYSGMDIGQLSKMDVVEIYPETLHVNPIHERACRSVFIAIGSFTTMLPFCKIRLARQPEKKQATLVMVGRKVTVT